MQRSKGSAPVSQSRNSDYQCQACEHRYPRLYLGVLCLPCCEMIQKKFIHELQREPRMFWKCVCQPQAPNERCGFCALVPRWTLLPVEERNQLPIAFTRLGSPETEIPIACHRDFVDWHHQQYARHNAALRSAESAAQMNRPQSAPHQPASGQFPEPAAMTRNTPRTSFTQSPNVHFAPTPPLSPGLRELAFCSTPLTSKYEMSDEELEFLHYLVECQKKYWIPAGFIDFRNDSIDLIARTIREYLATCLTNVTLFARSIAGFDAINEEDKLLLIKRAFCELLFMWTKWLYISVTDQFNFCEIHLSREVFGTWVFCGKMDLSEKLFDFWKFCPLSAEKNPELMALLSAWRIVKNLEGLKEPEKVKEILVCVAGLVDRYVGGMDENDRKRMMEIINDLEAVECVARECTQMIWPPENIPNAS